MTETPTTIRLIGGPQGDQTFETAFEALSVEVLRYDSKWSPVRDLYEMDVDHLGVYHFVRTERQGEGEVKYTDLGWEWYPINVCRVCGLKARRATLVSGGCDEPDLMVAVCGPACAKKVEDDPEKYKGLLSQHG